MILSRRERYLIVGMILLGARTLCEIECELIRAYGIADSWAFLVVALKKKRIECFLKYGTFLAKWIFFSVDDFAA